MLDTLPANTFVRHGRHRDADVRAPLPSSEQGVDPQSIRSFQARVTWQISPEEQARRLQRPPAEESRLRDDRRIRSGEAGIVWNSPIYTTGRVKFSSTASNKIFIEAGFSTNYERYNTLYQPGLRRRRSRPSGTP